MAMIKEAPFKFVPFTKKQKQILTWWLEGTDSKTGKPFSPHCQKEVFICDGAVRSGKTVIMSLSFVNWAMASFNYTKFGMAGKTIGSFRRNVLSTLKIILRLRGYIVKDHRADNYLIIRKKIDGVQRENYFYIFGGKDERSQDLVQGFTSGGFFFDEVALMPETFVNQAVARCSEEGRKLWFNCNPDGPFHWFKTEWIDKIEEKNGWRLHFLLEDNPSLSKATIAFYKNMFKGIFYQRFILGLWVLAEGIIYDMFEDDNLYGNKEGPDLSLPYKRYYAIDYGTINPCVFLEIIEQDDNLRVPTYYIDNEYYYDSQDKGRQKDDAEYAQDLKEFIDNKDYVCIIIDPSAASFKTAGRKLSLRFKNADNDVLDGIRLTASLMTLRRLKVHKERCRMWIKERASYIWNVKKAEERGPEEPVKQNDHAMDATRYFAKTVVKYIRGKIDKKAA